MDTLIRLGMHLLLFIVFVFASLMVPVTTHAQASMASGNHWAEYWRLVQPQAQWNYITSADLLAPGPNVPSGAHPWQHRPPFRRLQQAGASAGAHTRPWQYDPTTRRGGAEFSGTSAGTEAGVSGWVHLPSVYVSHNSHLPHGAYDGPLWQGRGWNRSVSAGVSLRYGRVELDALPVFVHSQNTDFALSPLDPMVLRPDEWQLSPFAQPLMDADLPQRMGDEPVSRLDPGLVSLRYRGRIVTAGLNHGSAQAGPARIHPILQSAQAPGFWNVHLSTTTPLQTPIGAFALAWFTGNLSSSEWFRHDVETRRYVSAVHIVYSHERLPGLEIGLHRTAYGQRTAGLPPMSAFLAPFRNSVAEPEPNQQPAAGRFVLKSLSARWALPETGFEFYGEWGRHDFRRPFRDLFLEPELNRGYVVGFSNRFLLSGTHWLVLAGEITQLENSNISTTFRPSLGWYEHPSIAGGFTHRGQPLGAAIGPGSGAQSLGLTWFNRFGLLGAQAMRVVHNNDRLFTYRSYYESIQRRPWDTLRKLHQVEMRYEARMVLFLPRGVEVSARMAYSHWYNRYNVIENDYQNLHGAISVQLPVVHF